MFRSKLREPSVRQLQTLLRQSDQALNVPPHLTKLLGSVSEGVRRSVACDVPVLRDAVEHFLAQPGKLVRPLLTLLACEAAGGNPADAVRFASAIELVHCSSLIFDDLPCMDDAPSRRGQPTLHVRFGEAAAVLVGIHFLSCAFKEAAAGDRWGGDATGILSHAISPNGMISGQILDIAGCSDDDHVRDLKTAPLFRAAAQLGAYSAGADADQQELLRDFATRLSLALQLRDDVLDGTTPPKAQSRAEKVALDAAESIAMAFNGSEAALGLASIAIFSAMRAQ